MTASKGSIYNQVLAAAFVAEYRDDYERNKRRPRSQDDLRLILGEAETIAKAFQTAYDDARDAARAEIGLPPLPKRWLSDKYIDMCLTSGNVNESKGNDDVDQISDTK